MTNDKIRTPNLARFLEHGILGFWFSSFFRVSSFVIRILRLESPEHIRGPKKHCVPLAAN
jgi:hypothetical protein